MDIYRDSRLDPGEIEDLFPRHPKPLVPRRAADVLQSNMITGFEQAIEQGMGPMEAFATILGWVSCEMARLDAGHAAGVAKHRK